jgi:hypothetical protein
MADFLTVRQMLLCSTRVLSARLYFIMAIQCLIADLDVNV